MLPANRRDMGRNMIACVLGGAGALIVLAFVAVVMVVLWIESFGEPGGIE
jgi:hypothetical protein